MDKLDTERWAASVPPGMRALPRWCVWCGSKRPLTPKTGLPAAVDDPTTWGTFEDTKRWYKNYEDDPTAGAGFVFTKGDELVFLDLDHCLNDDGLPLPWARDLATRLAANTYVEVSPSGRGLHAFVVGELPRAEGVTGARVAVEDGAVEVYGERRFSTVTGVRWGSTPLSATLLDLFPLLPQALRDKLTRSPTLATQTREPLARRREVWAALQAIDPDCSNDEWVTVGMALKSAFGDAGLPLWRSWSRRGRKYKEGEPEERWRSFNRAGVGLGTIFHRAREAGWTSSYPEADVGAFDEARRTWWTVPLVEVEDERLQWLVKDLGLVRGYASLLAGDPGRGKSLVTLDVASRLTAGRPMPWEPAGTEREPCRVLYLNAEDGAGDTIKPRARAAGADLSRFEVLDVAKGSRVPQLPDDVAELESMLCERPDVQLVVIDPLNAFLSRDVDAHKAHDVRQALQPLGDVLKRTSRAVWDVAHLNKNEAMSALYRVSGSADQTAFVRTALLLGKDPEDEDEARRVLAPLKWNFGPPPPARWLSIVDAGSGDAGKVEWGDESDVGAEDAVRRQSRGDAGAGAVGEAEAWLRTLLAAGPLPSREVESQARCAGVSRATLNRAARKMGLRREKTEGGWRWPQVAPPFEEEEAAS